MVFQSAVFFILVQGVGASSAPQQECAVAERIPESSRTDCGYNGITQAACEQKGCCWKATADATNPNHYPWCFLSAPGPVPPAGEVCKEPDTNKTVTCSGTKPDCCVGLENGPATCYNKSEEECCYNNAHGVNRPCQIGKCLHSGARASERLSCCSADTTPCSGEGFYAQGECCRAGQQCCVAEFGGEVGACCPAESVCCSPKSRQTTCSSKLRDACSPKCCPAGSTCCNSAETSTCCPPGQKCFDNNKDSPFCVPTLPAFMAMV